MTNKTKGGQGRRGGGGKRITGDLDWGSFSEVEGQKPGQVG